MMRLLPLFALLALVGCRKDGALYDPILLDTINLNDVYGTRSASITLGSDYNRQAYYSLVDDSLVGMHSRYAWDVAVATGEVPTLQLNAAIPGLRIAYTYADWEVPAEPEGLEWLYDLPTGREADLAVGLDHVGQTLLLDRGLAADGTPRGFKKLALTLTDSTYVLRVADPDGSNEVTFPAVPDPAFNLVTWSLDDGAVHVQPPKATWDLLLTNYLHVYDPATDPFPYQVTGALLNPAGQRGARLDGIPFDQAAPAPLSDALDVIGFDWKYYDFDLGYVMTPDLSFLVECGDGQLRALAFTGFTDLDGNKGTPSFTYRLLP